MSTRVSKIQIETQGRVKHVVPRERKTARQSADSRSYTETYQVLLAKELLLNDFQDSYCKHF